MTTVYFDIERAWAAGFFEADGSTTCRTEQARDNWYRFSLRASQSGEEQPPQLARFAATVDGRIYGPYKYKGNRKPQWQVCMSGPAAVEAYHKLRPYMTEGPKRAKGDADLAMFEDNQKTRTRHKPGPKKQ